MRKKVLLAIGAVVALVAIPVIAISQPTSSVGGSPSNVYTVTHPDVCLSATNQTEVALQQEITVQSESHVLVFFTTRWGRLGSGEEGGVSLALDQDETFGWNIPGNQITRTTQTPMWTFANVEPGTYMVRAFASVTQSSQFGNVGGRPSADLTECALTVFVNPTIS
jgi:hypothetical protein